MKLKENMEKYIKYLGRNSIQDTNFGIEKLLEESKEKIKNMILKKLVFLVVQKRQV